MGSPSVTSLSRFFSRNGWGWFVLSTIAKMYLTLVTTLVAIALLPLLVGWHGSVVQTGSMEPHISPGDVVVTSALDENLPVPVGYVVEYHSPASAEPSGEPRIRLHRIVTAVGDGTYITAGDANADVDSTPITREQIIGQGRILIPFIGLPQLWVNTGNIAALVVWVFGTGVAIVIVAAPPRRKKRPPADPEPDTAVAGPLPEVSGSRDAAPTRGALRVASRSGLTIGAVLVALTLGISAVGHPLPVVDAAFTARTVTAGNSWQVSTSVDTRGYGNYRSVIGADAPWAYYPVDEVAASFTAQDQSGNDRDATYSWSGVSETVGPLTRETNRAITLNGTAAATFATPQPVTAPTVFTLELWFRTGSGQGGELASFGSSRTGTSSTTSRKLYLGTDGRIVFGARAATSGVITSPRSYNDSAWHHVVATRSASGQLALYVDGQLVASRGNTPVVAGTGYWRFGGDTTVGWPNRPTNTYFSGSIDEIAVYQNTALTAARVQAHYQAALPTTLGNYPDQVAADSPSYNYHLDEGAPGKILDHSGYRQDATYPATGVTHNVVGVLPKRNNRAADFDGTNGSLVSMTASTGPQTFSVETWFKTTTKRGGQLIGFANTSNAQSTQYDRKVYMTNAGQLVFGVYPGTVRTLTTPATYNDGNWHHVVATLSTGGMRLYVDGKLVTSDATVRGAEAYSGYWHIGAGRLVGWPSPPSSDWFDGSLDEIAIYSTALTDARISEHYRAR